LTSRAPCPRGANQTRAHPSIRGYDAVDASGSDRNRRRLESAAALAARARRPCRSRHPLRLHRRRSGSRRAESAAEIHRRLLPLVDALFCVTNPIPVKYALNRLGFDVGPFRLPLCEPDATTGERIMTEVRHHTIDLPLAV